jgi:hypothetical protein
MIMTLYRATGTDKAGFFMFIQRQTVGMKASASLGTWIPKSQFKILESAEDRAWYWNECRVEVADWFVKQQGLVARQEHVRKHHMKEVFTRKAPTLRPATEEEPMS